jgi:hypothetical protein
MGMEMQDSSDGRPTNCIEQTATKETNVVKMQDPLMGTGNLQEIMFVCDNFLLYVDRGDFDHEGVIGPLMETLADMVTMRREIHMPIANWWSLEDLERALTKLKERYAHIHHGRQWDSRKRTNQTPLPNSRTDSYLQ